MRIRDSLLRIDAVDVALAIHGLCIRKSGQLPQIFVHVLLGLEGQDAVHRGRLLWSQGETHTRRFYFFAVHFFNISKITSKQFKSTSKT